MKVFPAVLVLLVACSSREFSRSESEDIFDEVTDELHRMHLDWLEIEPLPDTYTHACPEGGQVVMDAVVEGVELVDLRHELEACGLGGFVISGPIDYLDFEYGICEGQGFGFDIAGMLEVTGAAEGTCGITAREECGSFSGDHCGHGI